MIPTELPQSERLLRLEKNVQIARRETGRRYQRLPRGFGTAALLVVCLYLAADWLLSLSPLLAGLLAVASAVVLIPAVFVADYVRLTEPKNSGGMTRLRTAAVCFVVGGFVTAPALRLSGLVADAGYYPDIALAAATVVAFYVFVAPLEEALKMWVVYVVGVDARRVTPLGYAVLGAFVGLGFAYGENAVHLLAQGLLGPGNPLETALSRAPVGPLHVLLSTVAGYHVGRFHRSGSIDELLRGFVVVVVLHGTYNTLVVSFGAAEVAVIERTVMVVFFAVLGWAALRRIEDISVREALRRIRGEIWHR